MAHQSVNQLPVPCFIPRYRITLVQEGGDGVEDAVTQIQSAGSVGLRNLTVQQMQLSPGCYHDCHMARCAPILGRNP